MAAQPVLRTLSFWAFVAFLFAYVGILSTAMFVFQFGFGELPCPLCILQRMGMMLSSMGALYVVARALRGPLSLRDLTLGLGLAILGAVAGASISIRQILLHITPGDPGYGTAVLGLHLYTWALVTFVVVVVFAGVVAVFAEELLPVAPSHPVLRTVAWVVIWAFIATIAINMVVVFAEAGFNWLLPDDPTRYELFG
ncbi:disulfide bond formation protein B [Microbacterium sp. LRZ72]|uniref:disulfide bond formation protein B n=1 Tax=Microbacterium sp. LRZ72 TaxID=2942481 RepID=UPI0029B1D4B7|nr:disulfide bond formation protein B [Microbacterium sp. LRZ72]MDX2375316.1 disulfide bond formation protein B [Microbacterium sp. LRZ72]